MSGETYTVLAFAAGVLLTVLAVRVPALGENRLFHVVGLAVYGFLAFMVLKKAPTGIARIPYILNVGIVAVSGALFIAIIVGSNLFKVVSDAIGLSGIKVPRMYSRPEAAAAKGDLEKAERLYREALDEHPKEPEPHRRLAALYEKMGRYDEAVEELRTFAAALEKAEDYLMAALEVAELLDEKLGRRDQAIRVLGEALTRFPDAHGVSIVQRRLAALKSPETGKREADDQPQNPTHSETPPRKA